MHFVDLLWCVWKLDMPQKTEYVFPIFSRLASGDHSYHCHTRTARNLWVFHGFPRFSHPKITAVSPGPWPPPRRRKGVLRISAGRAAAVAGIHPYAEVGEIFLELLYQDRKAEGNGEKCDVLGWKWMEKIGKIWKFYEVFISLICDIYITSFKDEEWCTLNDLINQYLMNIPLYHYIPIIPPWFIWEDSEIDGKDVWTWLYLILWKIIETMMVWNETEQNSSLVLI